MSSSDAEFDPRYEARVERLALELRKVGGANTGATPKWLSSMAELRDLPQVARRFDHEADPEDLSQAIIGAVKKALSELDGYYRIELKGGRSRMLSADSIRCAVEAMFRWKKGYEDLSTEERSDKVAIEIGLSTTSSNWRRPRDGPLLQIMRHLARQLLPQEVVAPAELCLREVEVTYFFEEVPYSQIASKEEATRANVVGSLEIPDGTHTRFTDSGDYLWFCDHRRATYEALDGCQIMAPKIGTGAPGAQPENLLLRLIPPATKGAFRYSYRIDYSNCDMRGTLKSTAGAFLSDDGDFANFFEVAIQPAQDYRLIKLNFIAIGDNIASFRGTAHLGRFGHMDRYEQALGELDRLDENCLSYTFDAPAQGIWRCVRLMIRRNVSSLDGTLTS